MRGYQWLVVSGCHLKWHMGQPLETAKTVLSCLSQKCNRGAKIHDSVYSTAKQTFVSIHCDCQKWSPPSLTCVPMSTGCIWEAFHIWFFCSTAVSLHTGPFSNLKLKIHFSDREPEPYSHKCLWQHSSYMSCKLAFSIQEIDEIEIEKLLEEYETLTGTWQSWHNQKRHIQWTSEVRSHLTVILKSWLNVVICKLCVCAPTFVVYFCLYIHACFQFLVGEYTIYTLCGNCGFWWNGYHYDHK